MVKHQRHMFPKLPKFHKSQVDTVQIPKILTLFEDYDT